MDEHTLEIYNNSFEYCTAQSGFLPRFYELFLDSSPEVKEKFRNTDIQKQARILRKSLYTLTMASVGTEEARQEIIRLGQSHGLQGLRIPPYMYELWLDCLLQAVREYDANWSAEVERSWRDLLGPHLVVLKSYSQP